jgi:hypothetical protein
LWVILQIATTLQVPVSYFFDNAPVVSERPKISGADASLDYLAKFVTSAEGLALCKAFMSIKDSAMRRLIVALAEAPSEPD